VRLDRGIEIAVNGVGPFGLAPEIAAQSVGLGLGVRELGPKPIDLPECVGQLATERVGR